ncbi:hypothetical protein GQ457_11G023550 [Hibiscus cannabinus]
MILCRNFDALAGNTFVDSLHGLLSHQWLIRIRHISREINGMVDSLVVISRDVPIVVLEFPSVPTELANLVVRDALSG